MGSLLDSLFSGIAALLAFCYSIVGDYALAIAMFTLIIMLAFTPLTLKSTRSMMAMQRLQPEMKRLQTKYRDDRQTLNEEMMALYQREGVNPLGGCLPILIQMPIFLVLFQVLRGLTRNASDGSGDFDPKYLDQDTSLYKDLVAGGGEMQSLGVDLARQANDVVRDDLVTSLPYILLVGITALTSWYQQRQMAARRTNTGPLTPQAQQQQAIMKILPWMLPVFAFFMPAGLVVYFIVSNLYRVGQQAYIQRTLPNPAALTIDDDDDDEPAPAKRKAERPANSERPARAERPQSNRPRPRPRPQARGTRPSQRRSSETSSGNGAAPAPTSRTGGAKGQNRSASKKKRKKR